LKREPFSLGPILKEFYLPKNFLKVELKRRVCPFRQQEPTD